MTDKPPSEREGDHGVVEGACECVRKSSQESSCAFSLSLTFVRQLPPGRSRNVTEPKRDGGFRSLGLRKTDEVLDREADSLPYTAFPLVGKDGPRSGG